MPTTTSLNLQALLKTAAARTGMDSSASHVRGLSPSAQALYVAARSSHRKNAVCVVVVPGDEDVDRFCIDTRFFLAALEGASASALEDAVKPFPSLQIDPYRNIAPHFGVASTRAAALHAIANGRAKVVVASAAALLTRLSAPGNLEAAAIELRNGMDLDPVALGDLLADAGFTREDPVDEHGEFCVRGGIVDYFPGRGRQSGSGRVRRRDDRINPPVRSFYPAIDRDPRSGGSGAADGEVRVGDVLRLPAVRSRCFRSSSSKRRMRPSRPGSWLEQTQLSFEEAKAENPKAPAPEELLISWLDVAERLSNATRLDQLAIGDSSTAVRSADLQVGQVPLDIACQPAVEFRGRIQEWIAEVKRMRERGDTVVFVAGTEGRAERTAELLGEYGLRGILIDRTDELLNVAVHHRRRPTLQGIPSAGRRAADHCGAGRLR